MADCLGIIGGMGPLATVRFYEIFIRATPARRDQDHPRVVIEADPSIPDRTAHLRGQGPDPAPALALAARRLEQAGCDLLVMPCNTAHAYASQIAAAVSIPLLNWVDVAAEEAARHSSGPVGVLATDGTLLAGLYQASLARFRLKAVLPDADDQRTIMSLIYGSRGVKAGAAPAGARDQLSRVAGRLAAKGAECVVLGCTELPEIMSVSDNSWQLRAVDPAMAVARTAVSMLLGDRRAEA